MDGNWRISWLRRSRRGGDDFDAASIPLGEDNEAYRITLLADDASVQTWESATDQFMLSAKTRRRQRAAHRHIQDWRLAVEQLNARGAAGAPLHIPLPINEES